MHVTAALFAGIKKPAAIKPVANLWQAVDVVNDARFAHLMAPKAGVARADVRLPR